MKYTFNILKITFLSIIIWQCQPNKPQVSVTPDVVTLARQTHKEAVDTLRVDTTAAIVPSVHKSLSLAESKALIDTANLATLFVGGWPDNGFYGPDNYRIEFIITKMEKSAKDPFIYFVEGKNKFKKTISTFKGSMVIQTITEFTDPNLDTTEIEGMNILKTYSMSGTFRFNEDSTLNTSGLFAGTFKADFSKTTDRGLELWFFTDDTPARGSGYRFDGNWTSYKDANQTKPVLWSRDLFRFANDILENFSYGERDIEINPKYRSLGWDNFWEGDEWWNETPNQ